eukprot:NODE_48_length_27236_cov_0.507573.p11 type:complete len:107 gc:universal NODE_48_length_27236_cov_0.507573:24861-24541(-)
MSLSVVIFGGLLHRALNCSYTWIQYSLFFCPWLNLNVHDFPFVFVLMCASPNEIPIIMSCNLPPNFFISLFIYYFLISSRSSLLLVLVQSGLLYHLVAPMCVEELR